MYDRASDLESKRRSSRSGEKRTDAPEAGPMLLLTFRVSDDLYAVAAERVVEVVPRVELRPIPHAPACLAGLFNYRGKAVPVIDLGILLGSTPCLERLH